jgi:predicted DNA-binding mobile mystery protein A
MGKHLGISGAAITKMENRERDHSITLRDLERAADLFQCRLVYALLPIETLEETLRDQANRTSAELTRKADHMMKLEEQAVSPAELRAQREVLAKALMESLDPRIWDNKVERGKK